MATAAGTGDVTEASAPGPLMSVVRGFFDAEGWSYEELPGRSMIRLGYGRPDDLSWVCYAQTAEADEQFVFYSVPPLGVPEDRRPAVTEFITRANFGLRIGTFELDLDDGEVRLRAGIDVEGDSLSAALVRQVVFASVTLMERYLPGLLAVVNIGADPALAIREIESL